LLAAKLSIQTGGSLLGLHSISQECCFSRIVKECSMKGFACLANGALLGVAKKTV